MFFFVGRIFMNLISAIFMVYVLNNIWGFLAFQITSNNIKASIIIIRK